MRSADIEIRLAILLEAVTPLTIPQFWPPDSLDYRSELILPAELERNLAQPPLTFILTLAVPSVMILTSVPPLYQSFHDSGYVRESFRNLLSRIQY